LDVSSSATTWNPRDGRFVVGSSKLVAYPNDRFTISC
jgi:hypothetical protein